MANATAARSVRAIGPSSAGSKLRATSLIRTTRCARAWTRSCSAGSTGDHNALKTFAHPSVYLGSDMKKPLNPKFDPFNIFEHASHFHESDHRLRNTVPRDRPDQIPLIAHPAMVLSSFASELYLKCLLCIETGDAPNIHNLKDLFRRLQPATRRRLEDLWDEDIRRPERQRAIEAIRSLPGGDKLRLDLLYALDIGADSFIELRYFYEKQSAYFLLGDFPNLLRRVILEHFPGWASVPPTPSKN